MANYINPRDRPTTKGWSTTTSTSQSTKHYSTIDLSSSYNNRSIGQRRTPLSTSLGARIDRHLHLPSMEEKIIRKQQERQDQRKVDKILHDIEKIKTRYSRSSSRDVEISDNLKSAIRGKTASQISSVLLSESKRAINNSKRLTEKLRREARSESEEYNPRRTSTSRRLNNIKYVDQRLLDDLDSEIASSLCDVRSQMYRINQRADELYLNKKCNHNYY